MSHASVLVIGPNPEKQMAPFQENNMGDCPKEFMEFVNVEEESREKYLHESTTKVQHPTRGLVSEWDDEFRKEGSFGIGGNTHEVPKEYPIIQVDFVDLFPTFEEYMREYEGYEKRDLEKNAYGYWHNPNCKWDWYVLGGRFRGHFKLKEGGRGITKEGVSTTGYADQCMKSEIDFVGMCKEAAKKAEEEYERVATAFGGEIPKIDIPWEEFLKGGKYASLSLDQKREMYWAQPANAKLKELQAEYWRKKKLGEVSESDSWIVWVELPEYQCTKEDFIDRVERRAISTFAVVKDGVWYEKGEMGWWGMVSNEKDGDDWEKEFYNLIKDLPGHTMLTIFDYHI